MFDPRTYGLPVDDDIADFLSPGHGIHGGLNVDIFGGGSWQSEFSLLTGLSSASFGRDSYHLYKRGAGRFAAIGPDLSYAIGPNTQIIDAAGRYMVPGLCDAHMHVESGMVTVTEFCRAVIPHGTTSMFIDMLTFLLSIEGKRTSEKEKNDIRRYFKKVRTRKS